MPLAIGLALSGICPMAQAWDAEGLWSFGFRSQGFYNLSPGNDYFIGPEIGYSNFNLAAHRLQFKASYMTSRLEKVFREDTPQQDYFLLSPVWHVSRNGFFDPTLQADLGYARFDPGSRKAGNMDKDAWIAALQAGLALNLFQGEYGLFAHFGFDFAAPIRDEDYPGVFGVGLWKML
jgi:hypothetical protein